MLKDTLASFLEWLQGIGPWGAVLFAIAYVPAAVLFVPGSLLTLAAGFVFGLPKGMVIVSVGSTAGAAAAFIVARSLAHDWVARRVARRPTLAAIGRAVETEGFKIVLLTRLSPVFPFNLLNYAYGVTSVPFRTYVLASWMGMLPGTIMYVYLGSAAKSLAALLSGEVPQSAARPVLFALGLAATVAVTILVTRRARRALNEIVADETAEHETLRTRGNLRQR
jgi:uncharacterized membrane protein YdjX (TVP38/TMEM64 family)